jgi:hypothetical protein
LSSVVPAGQKHAKDDAAPVDDIFELGHSVIEPFPAQ